MIIFQPGDVFAGRYRLEERIGQGGMGTVWRATQLALNREVAVKLILPTATDDARYRRMFMDEAQLSARLVHPNIVPVVDYGEEGELLWLVQQFIRGSDLGKIIARVGGGMPAPLAIHAATQVLYALQCAHENFVIHRDIKPGNVLVSHDGNVLLTDFGIAKVFAGTPSISTVIKGSPGYMAPEILRGEPAVPATDLFAIGALLWECLTGANLFAHGMFEREQIYLATLHNPVPPLAAVGIAAPPGLDDILQRLMAKRVADRYATATQVIDDLLAVAAPFARETTPKALRKFVSAYVDAGPPRAPTPMPEAAVPNYVLTDRARPEARQLGVSTRTSALSGQVLSAQLPRRRGRTWIVLGALVAVGGIAAGVVAALQPKPAPPPAPAVAAPTPPSALPDAAPVKPPAGKLTVDVTPSDATVYLDGAPSPAHREDLVVGREATLRVERPGHIAQERTIWIGTETSVSIVLVPVPEEKSADTRKPATSTRHSTKTRVKEAPAPPAPPLTTPATQPEEEPPPMIRIGAPKK